MLSSRHGTFFALVVALALSMVQPGDLAAQSTPPYVRTAIVSPVPGNPTASGQNLLSTLASITGASSNHRWLLKIEPGVYDVGTTPFQMKPWVDVEGSGRIETVIRGAGQPNDATFSFTTGVVQGASSAEMRELTVSCVPTSERPQCLTIANHQASPSFLWMDVTTATNLGGGSRWGIRNTQASPRIDDVRITVAFGINNYGIVNAVGSAPTIRQSFIKVVEGENENDGILNVDGGAPVLVNDTTLQVRNAVRVHGIRDLGGGTPTNALVLRRVEILADGDTAGSYGVLGGSQKLIVEHSKIDARGANGHCIEKQIVGYSVTVNHSELIGAVVLVEADVVQIGATWLRGGGSITGYTSEQCAAVYTNDFTFFPNTCP